MTISPLKGTERQLRLFDEPLGGHGHIRTLIGEWTECFFASIFNLNRHKTDCTADYCPDLSTKTAPTTYFECKGVGLTKQTFVYSGRLTKDRVFFEQGNELYYLILHHTCKTTDYQTVNQLLEGWKANLQSIYVIHFQDFANIASFRSTEPLNSKYGHSDDNPTYGSGKRIPLSLLTEHLYATVDSLPNKDDYRVTTHQPLPLGPIHVSS